MKRFLVLVAVAMAAFIVRAVELLVVVPVAFLFAVTLHMGFPRVASFAFGGR